MKTHFLSHHNQLVCGHKMFDVFGYGLDKQGSTSINLL